MLLECRATLRFPELTLKDFTFVIWVYDLPQNLIQANSPINAELDGRIVTGSPADPTPVDRPDVGASGAWLWSVAVIGVLFVALGLLARRRAN
ncbi:hypothetical protein ACFLYP_00945 [Chloroflexota bacterium]